MDKSTRWILLAFYFFFKKENTYSCSFSHLKLEMLLDISIWIIQLGIFRLLLESGEENRRKNNVVLFSVDVKAARRRCLAFLSKNMTLATGTTSTSSESPEMKLGRQLRHLI